ncbi:MAG: PadR family transcriptional regulator [Oscillospiraceae bacterium]|nr:PadR family transcriptional regulator [Oscillospiraceae bacterium]
MSGKTQMMKGILEGCVLKLLSEQKLYSQEICGKFAEFGFNEVSRGTVLPLLMRMENEELITFEKTHIPNGPARKYYIPTEKGLAELKEFEKNWNEFYVAVCKIMEGGKKDEE